VGLAPFVLKTYCLIEGHVACALTPNDKRGIGQQRVTARAEAHLRKGQYLFSSARPGCDPKPSSSIICSE